jgi:hypothetical protein
LCGTGRFAAPVVDKVVAVILEVALGWAWTVPASPWLSKPGGLGAVVGPGVVGRESSSTDD